MRKYSDFFQTLHDEQGPTGYLGRGTHYSILRAVVFHDASGAQLPKAQFADFAVIWDEDHDQRVIERIEKVLRSGLLSRFLMFGERQGMFTAVLANQIRDRSELSALQEMIERITQHPDDGDAWPARVVNGVESSSIIQADPEKVILYLSAIEMLWQLGVKPPSINETLFNPVFLRRVDDLELSLRSANCLKFDNIVYIGDLVQKSEEDMLRTPNFGRKGLAEITEVIAKIGLRLGMDVPAWPPKNIEALAKAIGASSVSA